ncbi:MAG: hypothetical protein ABIL11_18585, partial [Chloroflexota bacterium]
GLDREAFVARAKAIYDLKYRKRLETQEQGRVVAIEIESGEIFVGRTALEAGLKARQKFPGKVFYFIRIGYPAVHSLKGVGRLRRDQGARDVPARDYQ